MRAVYDKHRSVQIVDYVKDTIPYHFSEIHEMATLPFEYHRHLCENDFRASARLPKEVCLNEVFYVAIKDIKPAALSAKVLDEAAKVRAEAKRADHGASKVRARKPTQAAAHAWLEHTRQLVSRHEKNGTISTVRGKMACFLRERAQWHADQLWVKGEAE